MAMAQKKPKVEKDRFSPDGVRLFNPTLPHGTVYSDGFIEAKFIQEYEGEELQYRGDGLPVGSSRARVSNADEALAENEMLRQRLAELEAKLGPASAGKPTTQPAPKAEAQALREASGGAGGKPK